MSRHALQKGIGQKANELKKCVLRSFLKRVRSAMSRRVEGRAFHASRPEKENGHSSRDVRHLGSWYDVLSAERRPGHVGLSAMAETVSASYAGHIPWRTDCIIDKLLVTGCKQNALCSVESVQPQSLTSKCSLFKTYSQGQGWDLDIKAKAKSLMRCLQGFLKLRQNAI